MVSAEPASAEKEATLDAGKLNVHCSPDGLLPVGAVNTSDKGTEAPDVPVLEDKFSVD